VRVESVVQGLAAVRIAALDTSQPPFPCNAINDVNLRAIVLVGKHAANAEPYLKANHPAIRLFTSAHPSPLVRAKFSDRWNSIPAKWAEARTGVTRHNPREAP
jgi:hypothetical protein